MLIVILTQTKPAHLCKQNPNFFSLQERHRFDRLQLYITTQTLNLLASPSSSSSCRCCKTLGPVLHIHHEVQPQGVILSP